MAAIGIFELFIEKQWLDKLLDPNTNILLTEDLVLYVDSLDPIPQLHNGSVAISI